jgi:hypothetical protein
MTAAKTKKAETAFPISLPPSSVEAILSALEKVPPLPARGPTRPSKRRSKKPKKQ